MGSGRDVNATLAEMDRRLQELQRELAGVSARSEAAPSPPPPPQPPPGPDLNAAETRLARIAAEARVHADALSRRVQDLAELRDELERSAAELSAAVDRARRAEAAQAGAAPAPEPPAPEPPAEPPPAPAAPPPAEPPPAPAAPPRAAAEPPAAAPGPAAATVALEAGPFADVVALSAFEEMLHRLPSVQEVFVRGLEGNRAHIDVAGAGVEALLGEMRASLPLAFEVTRQDAVSAVITVAGVAPVGY